MNRGRALIFSTAPAPLLAVQLGAALRVFAAEPERREQVFALARRLRRGLRAALPEFTANLGAAYQDERLPIIPLLVGEDARALALAEQLQARGFDVRAIRPPTVPEGTARLRLTVHAGQSLEAVDRLVAAIAAAMAGARPVATAPGPRPVLASLGAGPN